MNLVLFTGPHRSKTIYLIKENNWRSHLVGLQWKHGNIDTSKPALFSFFRVASGISTNWANGGSGTYNRRQQPMRTHRGWLTGNKSYHRFLWLFGSHWEPSRDLIQLQVPEASFCCGFKWPCFQPASVSLWSKATIFCCPQPLWWLVLIFFWGGGSRVVALWGSLICFTNLSQYISRLKKPTTDNPISMKRTDKQKEWVLFKNTDHTKLVTTQIEHTAHFSLTWSNNKRSCRSASPTHLLRQSAPFLIKKAIFLSPWLHSLASARATSVFPVPGGP